MPRVATLGRRRGRRARRPARRRGAPAAAAVGVRSLLEGAASRPKPATGWRGAGSPSAGRRRSRARAQRPAPRRAHDPGGHDEGPGHRRRALRQVRPTPSRCSRALPDGHLRRPGPTCPTDDDADWAARIAAHRARRPADWTHASRPATSPSRSVRAPAAVLVDCLGTWLDRGLDEEPAWEAPVGRSSSESSPTTAGSPRPCARTGDRVVVVTNEVGLGVVPGAPVGPAVPRPARHRQPAGGGGLRRGAPGRRRSRAAPLDAG